MLDALDTLRKANVEAGTIREDLTTETLMRGLSCLLFLTSDSDWKTETENVLDHAGTVPPSDSAEPLR